MFYDLDLSSLNSSTIPPLTKFVPQASIIQRPAILHTLNKIL